MGNTPITSISGAAYRPTFYVINDKPEMVDIDGDGIPDKLHSEIVAIQFKSQCPAAIQQINLDRKPDIAINTTDGVIYIADLAKNGLPITDKNVSSFKKQLADTYVNKTPSNRIRTINNLTAQNVPVFVAAGNTAGEISLSSLLPKVTVVGAKEQNIFNNMQLETAKYSSNTDLVTQWEQGTYDIRVIRETKDSQKGPQQGEIIGFNITNGDKVDIPVAETSSKGKNLKTLKIRFGNSSEYIEVLANKRLKGTSNAAPVAGGKAAVEMFGKKACGLTE